jgi:peptidoglycan hydrolase CwlO-like protein
LPTGLDNRARRRVACVLALVLAALCAFAAFGGRAPAQDPTELQQKVDELEGVQAQQGDLEAEIERQNAEVNELIAQEAAMREREAAVAEELSATQARLDEATAEVEHERTSSSCGSASSARGGCSPTCSSGSTRPGARTRSA